jgi:hypothetical protein
LQAPQLLLAVKQLILELQDAFLALADQIVGPLEIVPAKPPRLYHVFNQVAYLPMLHLDELPGKRDAQV